MILSLSKTSSQSDVKPNEYGSLSYGQKRLVLFDPNCVKSLETSQKGILNPINMILEIMSSRFVLLQAQSMWILQKLSNKELSRCSKIEVI